jgi:hypothetical protein
MNVPSAEVRGSLQGLLSGSNVGWPLFPFPHDWGVSRNMRPSQMMTNEGEGRDMLTTLFSFSFVCINHNMTFYPIHLHNYKWSTYKRKEVKKYVKKLVKKMSLRIYSKGKMTLKSAIFNLFWSQYICLYLKAMEDLEDYLPPNGRYTRFISVIISHIWN